MKKIITRADDFGSSRGANRAILEAAGAGFVKNISLMACGGRLEEAAGELRAIKNICFGMHFTMHSEWDKVKFPSLSPRDKISLLLDSNGDFYSSPDALVKSACMNQCREPEWGALIEQIQKEWNAQLDRLAGLGFPIAYVDTHMFPERVVPGLKEAMHGWIKEKGLIDHRYFYHPIPALDELSKEPELFGEVLENLGGGQYFYLSHPAVPEADMYLTGNSDISAAQLVECREADYRFVTSKETSALCEKFGIETIPYTEASPGSYDSAEEWLGNRNGYRVEKIDGDTWLIKDVFGDFIYLLQGDERAALIDTGIGMPGLVGVVSSLTSKPVMVLHTHGHLDHVGCDHEFGESYLHPSDKKVWEQHREKGYRNKIRALAKEVLVPLSQRRLAEMICLPAAAETKELSDGQTIDLGGRELRVISSPGHTEGSVCFLEPQRKRLYAGDTVCPIGVMLSFSCSASVEVFEDTLRKLIHLKPQILEIYPGHHQAPIGFSYVERYLECAKSLELHPEMGVPETSVFGQFRRYFWKDVSLTYDGREN